MHVNGHITHERTLAVRAHKFAKTHAGRFWTGAHGLFETEPTMLALQGVATMDARSAEANLVRLNRELGLPDLWEEV